MEDFGTKVPELAQVQATATEWIEKVTKVAYVPTITASENVEAVATHDEEKLVATIVIVLLGVGATIVLAGVATFLLRLNSKKGIWRKLKERSFIHGGRYAHDEECGSQPMTPIIRPRIGFEINNIRSSNDDISLPPPAYQTAPPPRYTAVEPRPDENRNVQIRDEIPT